jgi:hypothetical protein
MRLLRERASLADHAPFLVLLLAGVVLRGLVTMAYYPILMLQRDAYAYLDMTAGRAGSGFRPALYPLLIMPATKIHDLAYVAIAQHALGLAMSVLAYRLMRRLGAGRWLGAAAAAPVLLDGYQLNLEHQLLAEAVFQSMVLGALTLLLWRPRATPWGAAGTGLLIAMAGVTRFVGLALIGPAVVYVAWTRQGWLRLATLLIAFFTALLGYSAWSPTTSQSAGLAGKSGFFLYGRVASFSDCRKVAVPQELRTLCLAEPPEERGPNRGFFGMHLPEGVRLGPESARNFTRFSMIMIQAQPLDYLAVVASDFARFVEPASPPSQEPYVTRWRFVRSIDEAQPHPYVARRKASPPTRLGYDQPFTIDPRLANLLRSYQAAVYVWGPLLGMALLLGSAGAVWGSNRDGAEVRAASALLTLSVVALLIVPVAITVYHFRYVIAPLPLVGPAAVAGAVALRARLRGRTDSAPRPDHVSRSSATSNRARSARAGAPSSSLSHMWGATVRPGRGERCI